MDAKELVGLLRSRGLSQNQIAEKCGLSQGAISHIETGRRKNVFLTTHQQLQRLCDETATSGDQSSQVAV